MSKEKWEDKYNRYISGDLDKLIAEKENVMTTTTDGKYVTARSADVGDIENGRLTNEQKNKAKRSLEILKKIKENLPKISNILEYRKALQKKVDGIKEEINYRNALADASTKSQKLDEEFTRLTQQKEEAEKELRSIPETEVAKQEEVKARIRKINERQDSNQIEFSKAQEILNKNSVRHTTLSGKTTQELKNKLIEGQTLINKCNFACRLLMEGRSIDDIAIDLNKWQDRRATNSKVADNTRQNNSSQDNPSQNNPSQNNPSQDNPSQNNPSQNNPSQDNPSQDNPSQDNPSQNNPSQDNPSQNNPSQDNPSQNNPPQDNKMQGHVISESGENQMEEKAIEKVKPFLQKHPRLARFVGNIKGIWKKIRNVFIKAEKNGDAKDVAENENAKDVAENENANNFRDSILIKEFANEGYNSRVLRNALDKIKGEEQKGEEQKGEEDNSR